MSMQYGHWVVRATAIAISSLYLTGIAPSATDNLSKAQNAFITSGARALSCLILVRFSFLNIYRFVLEKRSFSRRKNMEFCDSWKSIPPLKVLNPFTVG